MSDGTHADSQADGSTDSPADKSSIDPKTLEMLVCPLTKTQLIWKPEQNELVSYAARLAFPIKKGIPLLFVGEARELTQDEIDAQANN